MLIKKSKSQAALEFLITYGWAFLVILIMIGTLAYFGILSPSKVLPNRCLFGAEFQCVDHAFSATANQIKLKVKNNVGEPINVDASGFNFLLENGTSICSASTAISGWKTGEIKELTFTCPSLTTNYGFVTGNKGRVNVEITYYAASSGSSYSKKAGGEIYTTVN